MDIDYVQWQGVAQLNAGRLSGQVECRVLLSGSPKKDLRIEVEREFGLEVLSLINEKVISVEIPGVSEPIELLLSSLSTGSTVIPFRVKRAPIVSGGSNRLIRGRTLAINFGQFWTPRANSRFQLEGVGWRVELIPVCDDLVSVRREMQSEEYRITYQVEFERADKATFRPQDAKDFLDNLHLFLSFCHGRWVATSMSVCLDERGEVGWEQWGTGKVSLSEGPSSWLDEYDGSPLFHLFDPFCLKLADEAWKEVFSSVVYWFERAETDNAGADGACILLQALLEKLAWQLIVREKEALSEADFEKLPAAGKIRLLLTFVGIPTAVPVGLVELVKLAAFKGIGGPEILTSIRNRLVHPPKKTAKREKVPYYETCELARWYLELSVLSICGYQGNYSDRTRISRWKGQVDKVPWA